MSCNYQNQSGSLCMESKMDDEISKFGKARTNADAIPEEYRGFLDELKPISIHSHL